MARKRLTPEAVYLPTKGVNPDGNGISLRPEECVDGVNLRFLPKDISVRDGSRRMANAVPSGDPILHFHTYKKPSGTEVLYGFTKNTIYKFVPGSLGSTGTWTTAIQALDHSNVAIDTCDSVSTANWTTGIGAAPAASETTIKKEGLGSCKLATGSAADNIASGTAIFQRHNLSVNLSGHASMLMWISVEMANTVTEDMRLVLKTFTSSNCTGSPIETSAEVVLTDISTTANFAPVQFLYITPAGLSSVGSFSVELNAVWPTAPLVSGSGINVYVDDIQSVGSLSLAQTVEFWDTTDIIDDAEGATVVAAGSRPPNPNEPEDDSASRVLFILDAIGTENFKPLTINHRVAISNEDSTRTIVAVGSAQNITGGTIKTGNIVPGLFSLLTDRGGTIVTASSVKKRVDTGAAEADGYALLATDPAGDKVVENVSSTGSWVKEDGTWELNFTPTTGNGYVASEPVLINYTYLEDSQTKPRFVRSFHNRLVMGNIYDDIANTYLPWQIRWTDVGDTTELNSLNFQDVVGTDITPITKLEYMGYYLYIYKFESKARMRHVGGTSIFLTETVEKRGCKAGKTIVPFRNVHFYLGEDDVYVFDGTSSFSITLDNQTGNHRVRDTLFQRINNASVNAHFGSKYEKHNEYWLWFVRGGKVDTDIGASSPEVYPSMALVFNAQLRIFYFFEFKTITSVGYFHSSSGEAWDNIVRSWGSSGGTWESGTLSGNPRAMVLARSTSDSFLMDGTDSKDYGYLDGSGGFVEGDDISYHFITRDFTWGDISRKTRTTRLDFECDGGTDTTVGYSLDYSTDTDTFKAKEDIVIDYNAEERTYFPDATSEHIRFLFEGTDNFRLRWIQPYGIVHDLPGE